MLSKEIHFYEHLLIRYESLLLVSKLYSFISHYYFLVFAAFAELNLKKKYVPTNTTVLIKSFSNWTIHEKKKPREITYSFKTVYFFQTSHPSSSLHPILSIPSLQFTFSLLYTKISNRFLSFAII